MADINTFKKLWNDGVRTVKKAATSLVGATRYKMDEMGSVSRRRELIADLGEKVYGLAQTGAVLPEDIAPLVKEIQELESGLAELRSDRVAAKAAAAEAAAADKAARAADRAAAKAAAAEAKAAAKAAAEAAAAMEAAAAAEAAPVLDVEIKVEEGPVYSGEMPDEDTAPVIEVKEEPEA